MDTLGVLKLFPSRVLGRVSDHRCPRPRNSNSFVPIEEPQCNMLIGLRSSSCTVRVNICCVPCHANSSLKVKKPGGARQSKGGNMADVDG